MQHQPGKLVGNDAVPEFQAQVLPPGSAPADRTFKPNPTDEAPPVAGSEQKASDTIGGATSGEVHTGLGHPGAGQSSKELHDGSKETGGGFQGVGATTTEHKTVDQREPEHKQHRALDNDDAQVGRGTIGGPAAEEREPESAESVASGR